jgi:hypothetical protein
VKAALDFLPVTELLHEVLRRKSKMHEIAEATAVAFPVLILTTARFTEVGDG